MSTNNLEKYRVTTRRFLALATVVPFAGAIVFLIVYGSLTKQAELVNLGAGIGGPILGAVLAYYFAKKTSEE